MKLLVTLEQRFKKQKDGSIVANDVFNYPFFARYLSAFDEVRVLARVTASEQKAPDSHRADGPAVSFLEVPYFVGPLQYFKKRRQVQEVVRQAVQSADAFMLRLPGLMGSLAWQHLKKHKTPYGVEVVGDPWDSLGTAGGRSLLKPFLRLDAYRKMKSQCAQAAVAAYVTERTLQKRYPPGSWTTHYSSIELSLEDVLKDGQRDARFEYAKQPFENKRPFYICHTGSMDALYKSQDTLIEAVALCRDEGMNIELHLLGDGRYRAVFENKAEKCQVTDKVHFLGMVPSSQVRDYLDKSDLFVLPSLTEGLPRVLIEAMSRGLPCLASRVGGNPELLSPEELFPVRDSQQLAQRMIEMFTDYQRLCVLAQKNIKKAATFTTEQLSPLRDECYRKLRDMTLLHRQTASNE